MPLRTDTKFNLGNLYWNLSTCYSLFKVGQRWTLYTRFQTFVVVSMRFSFFWVVRLHKNPEERRPQCTHFLNTHTCSYTHLKSTSLIFIGKIINKIIAKYWNLQGSVTYFLYMIYLYVAVVVFDIIKGNWAGQKCNTNWLRLKRSVL